jgi:tetratricopeptide (TPR) repeat protein
MIRILGAMFLILSVSLTPVFGEELFDANAAKQHFNAGLDLYFKKDYKEAIKQFEEAAQIDPDNANAFYFMGYSYYKLKDMKKAREVFAQAYEVDSKYSPLRNAPPNGPSAGEE